MSDGINANEIVEEIIHGTILAPRGSPDHDEAYAYEVGTFRKDPDGYLALSAEIILDRLEGKYPGLKTDGDPETVPPEIWVLTRKLDGFVHQKDMERDKFQAGLSRELAEAIRSSSGERKK